MLRFRSFLSIPFIIAATLLSFLSCSESMEKKENSTLKNATLYVTTLDQKQLLAKHVLLEPHSENADAIVTIDTSTTYQIMDGFGFTLNGGSALHLQGMSAPARSNLLNELFGSDSNSIGISYLRLSVGASDLDEKTWSYNDILEGETDLELDQFSMAYDTLYLIPTLKEIIAIQPKIKIMGSPWSPPVWMKDNNDTRGGSLKPEFYSVYADYLIRYIQEMKKEGIDIDALTIQNEPLHPGNNPSLLMEAEQQALFIKDHLGPKFVAQNIKTKIIIYDHNADRPDYPISILNDPEAAKYIDGSAFHLYGGKIEALSEVHEAHPSKNLYFTEQWIGAPGNFAGDFSWHIENLIIGAPKNWAKTVLEWNLAADENQQPHTDRGGCNRCLGALTLTGDSVVRNPGYYVIAQTSKFIPPGSMRIASEIVNNIPNVTYQLPDGNIAMILQNKNSAKKNIQIVLGEAHWQIDLPAGAVGTLLLENR
ncbi:MAG: glycoside hydrolase family 30 beta sandwich domain-containing protein [Maribacter sp.]